MMRRREFIAGLAGAAAWPVVAQAQQTAMPVLRFAHLKVRDEATGSKCNVGTRFYGIGAVYQIAEEWLDGAQLSPRSPSKSC